MKNRINGFGRKFTAVLVLLCMLFSIMAPTVMATTEDIVDGNDAPALEPVNKELNYVSIGDSMANGYGFVDYEQDSDNLNVYNPIAALTEGVKGKDYGKGMYGAGAYPLQFEKYLEDKGYTVNHKKLATSAMLPEDFLYLLGGCEKEIDDNYGGYRTYISSVSVADFKAFVQEAVTEADIITIGLGNANFGAFLMDKITKALGVLGWSIEEADKKLTLEYALSALDEADKSEVLSIVNSIIDSMDLAMVEDMIGEDKLPTVLNILEYVVATFIVNYKLCVEKILEKNPDVQIIFVGLLNTTYGTELQIDENPEHNIKLGDMMDDMFGMLNDYVKMLPTLVKAEKKYPEASFKFAEQPEPKFICLALDDLVKADWGKIDCGDADCNDCKNGACENGRLSGTTVRSRNIDAYNGDLRGMIGDAFGIELPKVSPDDVKAFEENNPSWAAAAMGYGFTAQGNDLKNLSIAPYLGLEKAIVECAEISTLTLDGFKTMTDINNLLGVFAGLDLTLDPNAEGADPVEWAATTPAVVVNKLHDHLLSTDDIRGLCKVYGMFKVGNGMSVHPTPAGHDEMVKTVIATYEGEAIKVDPKVAAIRDVFFYLKDNNYITLAQALDIATNVDIENMFDSLSYVYNSLLLNENLNDADRIDIIKNVYAIAKGDILGEYSPALGVVIDIYDALEEQGLIDASKAFAIIDFVYDCIIDGTPDSKEIVSIIEFVYYTLFFEKVEAVAFSLCAYELPELEELQALAAGEKIAILNTVIEELKDGGFVTEDSTFAPVLELYENLATNEVVDDAALAAVIDIAIESVIAKEELAADTVLDLGFEIMEKVTESDEIPAAAKEVVSKEIYDTVNKVDISGNNEPVIPGEIQCVIDRLYDKNLLTYTQVMQIVAKLRPLISGEKLAIGDIIGVLKDVANVVFNYDGITNQERILIVLNTYTALKNEGYITDEELVGYVKDYYGIALGVAFVYAYNEGYVEIAADALYVAVGAIEAAKAEVLASDLREEIKNAVIVEIDAAIEIITKVADFAKNPDLETLSETIEYFMNFEGEALAHLENAKNILEMVGSDVLDEALNVWENDVKPEVDALIADLEENGLEYLGEALKELAPIIGEAAWEALLGTPAAVKAFIEFVDTYGTYVIDFFEEYGVEFVTIFGNIAVEYGFDVLGALIDQGEEGLVALKDLVDQLGDEAWDIIWIYADALDLTTEAYDAIVLAVDTIKNQITTLEGYLVILEGELAALEAELYLALEDVEDELRAKIDEINAAIEDIKAAIAELRAELQLLIDEAKAIALEIANIANAVIDFVKALATQNYEDIMAALNNLSNAFDALIDRFFNSENILKHISALIEKLNMVSESIAGKLMQVLDDLAALKGYLEQALMDAIANLETELEAAIGCLLEKLAYIEEIVAEKLVALCAIVETAVEQINTLIANVEYGINALIAEIEAIFEAAFTEDYIFDPGKSGYVALGDKSATDIESSYAAYLAELIGMNKKHYTDLTTSEFGFSIDEMLETIVANKDVIANADLITLGYNNTAVYTGIVSGITDWESLFGAEVAEVIVNAVSEAEKKIIEYLEENFAGNEVVSIVKDFAVRMVEAYAYAYIARAINIHNVVAEIRSISPEALIVIVGAFNDFEGAVIDETLVGVEGFNLEIGEYIGYVVDALNASSVLCALYNENTIFVSTEGAETELEAEAEGEIAILDYISALAAGKLIPSAEGNKYIAEQIYAALNITVADHTHEYDHRCDKDCNTCGDERYAEHTYFNACDATCNICGEEREVEGHKYDSNCDDRCNVCGEKRTAAAHTFGNWVIDRESTYNIMGERHRDCTKCGEREIEYLAVLVADGAAGEGISAGTVVIITIPSLLGLGAGGFAAYWFGYKKKSAKELVEIAKKLLSVFKK